MKVDTTAVAIGLAVVFGLLYASASLWRGRTPDLKDALMGMLAAFALPPAGVSIYAAWLGDLKKLPADWRQYLAAAGFAIVWLCVVQLAKEIRKAGTKSAPRKGRGPREPS